MLDRTGASALAALLLVASCGGDSTPAPSPGSPSASRTLTTPDGRTLQLTDRPAAIVPTAAGAVDIVLELVEDLERIAALPEQTFGYANADVDERAFPAERRFFDYLIEPMLQLAPDLVVTHHWQAPDTTRGLVGHGLPVLILPDLLSFDGLLEQVRLVGEAVAEPERAAALVADLERRRAELAARDRSAVRAMTYSNHGAGGWTAGTETTGDLLLSWAGLTNVAVAEEDLEGYARMSFEDLLLLDPDVIVCGTSLEAGAHSTSLAVLESDPALAQLTAVREGRVVVLPARLFTASSHHVLTAAEELAAAVDAMSL